MWDSTETMGSLDFPVSPLKYEPKHYSSFLSLHLLSLMQTSFL